MQNSYDIPTQQQWFNSNGDYSQNANFYYTPQQQQQQQQDNRQQWFIPSVQTGFIF